MNLPWGGYRRIVTLEKKHNLHRSFQRNTVAKQVLQHITGILGVDLEPAALPLYDHRSECRVPKIVLYYLRCGANGGVEGSESLGRCLHDTIDVRVLDSQGEGGGRLFRSR